MNVRTLSLLPLALLAAAATAQNPAAPARPPVTLHVGDAAPELTIDKWLKGKPQTDLKDGKVHVVEFWATWCGPCKVGMPHLSELAKHYGKKAAFIGVDASESKDDVALAEKFVAQAGKMMDYNVAYAKPRDTMTKTWMEAAGQYGIPCAFVVDKTGKIGWIGHPLMGLEQAVDLAIDGKLDATSGAAIDQAWQVKLDAGEKTMKALAAARKDGKVDEALTLNEEAFANWPFIAPDYTATKYQLLTTKDPKAAKEFADKVLKENANAPLVLRAVATVIVNEKSDVKGDRDFKLAKNLLLKANNCMAPTASSSQQLAQAALQSGDTDLARKAQETAVALYQENLAKTNYGTTEAGLRAKAAAEKMLATAQATLDSIKSAKR
jgi:thiol-disulfide isomerase/thioredoxin